MSIIEQLVDLMDNAAWQEVAEVCRQTTKTGDLGPDTVTSMRQELRRAAYAWMHYNVFNQEPNDLQGFTKVEHVDDLGPILTDDGYEGESGWVAYAPDGNKVFAYDAIIPEGKAKIPQYRIVMPNCNHEECCTTIDEFLVHARRWADQEGFEMEADINVGAEN